MYGLGILKGLTVTMKNFSGSLLLFSILRSGLPNTRDLEAKSLPGTKRDALVVRAVLSIALLG